MKQLRKMLQEINWTMRCRWMLPLIHSIWKWQPCSLSWFCPSCVGTKISLATRTHAWLAYYWSNSYAVHLDFASGIGTIQRINNVIDGMDKQAKLLQENIDRCADTIKRGEAQMFLRTKLVSTISAKRAIVNPLIGKSMTSLRSLL